MKIRIRRPSENIVLTENESNKTKFSEIFREIHRK